MSCFFFIIEDMKQQRWPGLLLPLRGQPEFQLNLYLQCSSWCLMIYTFLLFMLHFLYSCFESNQQVKTHVGEGPVSRRKDVLAKWNTSTPGSSFLYWQEVGALSTETGWPFVDSSWDNVLGRFGSGFGSVWFGFVLLSLQWNMRSCTAFRSTPSWIKKKGNKAGSWLILVKNTSEWASLMTTGSSATWIETTEWVGQSVKSTWNCGFR